LREESFKKLKILFNFAHVLILIEKGVDITICYGASKVGLGGVLIKKERSFDLYLKIV